jgi:YD repeat-containing protein
VQGQSAVSYAYDNADRLTSVTQGTAVVSHAYDNADRETTLTLPSSVKQISVYDNADRPSSITYKRGSTTLGALSYDYDRASKPYATWGSYARTGLPTAVSSATYDAPTLPAPATS